MSFIPKNPLTIPEIEFTPSVPARTRGLFAKSDGWYEVDSAGKERKVIRDTADVANSYKYYGDAAIIPSNQKLFYFTIDEDKLIANIIKDPSLASDQPSSISGDIVIPYEYKHTDGKSYRVISIDDGVFENCDRITSLIFPRGMEKVGKNAFAGCTGIAELSLSANIIGAFAFKDCTNLTTVKIEQGTATLASKVFLNCTSLRRVTISSDILVINNSFSGCENLTDVYFESSEENWRVLDITDADGILSSASIHYDSVPATEGFVNEKLKNIPGGGVPDTKNFLTKEEASNSYEYYGDAGVIPSDQGLFNFEVDSDAKTAKIVGTCDEWGDYNPVNISGDIVIPYEYKITNGNNTEVYKVTEIGRFGLYSSNITNVHIPNTVTIIHDYAFQRCESLKSVTLPDSVTSIGEYAFEECKSLECVIIPNGVASIGIGAFGVCSSLKSITIPKSVTSVGNRAFYNCTSLKKVVLSDGITVINEEVFYGCSALTDVTIPSGISIENGAFGDCTGLKSITIPKGIGTIHDYAFQNNALTVIYFGGTKERWEELVGFGVNSLIGIPTYFNYVPATEWYVIDKTDELNNLCYYGESKIAENDMYLYFSYTDNKDGTCTINGANESNIDSIVVPYKINNLNVVSIADGAFSMYENLKNIIIPKGIKTIGTSAFSQCASLTNVILPEGITTIGWGAFYGCSSLVNVSIPSSVTDIGWHTFQNCTKLKAVTLPDGINHIGEGTFSNCTSLDKITIPDNVTQIYYSAFANCSNLKDITITRAVSHIDDDVFDGCSQLSITCEQDSYAEEFAKTNNIPYRYNKMKPANVISVTIKGGASEWTEEDVVDATGAVIGSRYGQVVYDYNNNILNISNAIITPNSKVDLQITSEQMVIFYEKSLAFVTENDGGVITVYCVGTIPQNDYTMQAVVTEVII